jgi:hypothetical protein
MVKKTIVIYAAIAAACLGLGPIHSAQAQTGPDTAFGLGYSIGLSGGISMVAYKTREFPIFSSMGNRLTALNGSDLAGFGGITSEFSIDDSHH